MQPIDLLQIAVLIFSVVLHEVAHGYMANALGDPTARLQGRLTLNPLRHLDPMGSVILPLLLKFSGSPILIGYAKPVPYNPYNLKGRYGEALVAAAGPATNIFLALIFGLAIRFFADTLDPNLLVAFAIIATINIMLAIFNLIPIPPLDGSKILSAILPPPLEGAYNRFRELFEGLGIFGGIVLLFVALFLFMPYLAALIQGTFVLITGLQL